MIRIPEAEPGKGGVGGGAGHQGQASQRTSGAAASSYGVPVIETTTGLTAQFTVQLTADIQGTVPACLEPYDDIVLTAKDPLNGGLIFMVHCDKLCDGQIKFTLTADDVKEHPGMHWAQIHCLQEQTIQKIFKCIVEIKKGITGADNTGHSPLTIAEVRMAAYDTCGQLNYLLDDLQFSDLQIAFCMQQAVDDWNQTPPTLADQQTVQTFPYRSHLCTGTLFHMFRMAMFRYNRNAMRHSNAGLVFDDQDKGQIYAQQAQMMQAEWTTWVNTKKTELNMLECMGTVSNDYMQGSYNPWWY